MVQRDRLLFGTVLMSPVYISSRRKFSHLSHSVLMAVACLVQLKWQWQGQRSIN